MICAQRFVLLVAFIIAAMTINATVEKPPVLSSSFNNNNNKLHRFIHYPLFKQCDPRWGREYMGPGTTTTICDAGCLESSFSMALAGHNITVQGRDANPGTVNQYNRDHGCFERGTSLLLDSCVDSIKPDKIKFQAIYHGHTSISLTEMNHWFANTDKIVIANVLNGAHFVLVHGVDTKRNEILVNDPGFDRGSYAYDSSIVGWNVWDMK